VDRRRFLTNSLLTSTLASEAFSKAAHAEQAAGPEAKGREYYELRCYQLQSGPQQKQLDTYLAEALIPALNRLGMSTIGAFNLYLGPETPAVYVLIPGTSLETLAMSDLRLAQDEEYLKAGAAFLNAPAKEPAYVRVESNLMIAFEGFPKVAVPPVTAQHGSRVFQLRTYESPSHQDHRRKVEMFNSGEFDIFQKAGFWNVFFGDVLIGPRLPKLTYMLSFPDLAELNSKWKAFQTHPDWKKLSSSPRFSYEAIVSSITNLILNPASYSQI
jgi:NIPSNAP